MLIKARVTLKKPNINELSRQGFTLVDMHVHSRFSDTYTKIKKIIERAEKKGIGVAVTDHNAIGGSKLAFRTKGDVLVIPGIETSSKEGPHILSYFSRISDLEGFYEACIKEKILGDPYTRIDQSVDEICRWTKEFNGITSAAHPFAPAMMGLYKAIKRGYVSSDVLNKINAVEVVTGVNLKRMTHKSINWAETLKKPITGGSDGHSLFEVGKVLTYCKASTPKKFIEQILSNNSFVVGKETFLASRVPSYTKTTNKHLKYIKPFIKTKTKCVMNESVYYHTKIINQKIRKVTVKGIEAIKNHTKNVLKKNN